MIQQALHNISEANAEYLNISIKNVDKVIKNEATAGALLNQDILIYGKYDGVKVSIFRNDKPWNEDKWHDMFTVSYKGNIIYGSEFADIDDNYDTIGESQYRVVTEHVKKYYKEWKGIPTNTEYFLEFLMNKPTLTRKYTKLRELILVGHAKVNSYKMEFGKITTVTGGLNMNDREADAKLLKVNLPELLFKGKLNALPKGLNSRAQKFYKDFKAQFENLGTEAYWELTKNFFLFIPSLYGAEKEEGVVIQLSTNIGKAQVLKIVQSDQYDKDLRFKIRMKWKMEPQDEDAYWKLVRIAAQETIHKIKEKTHLGKALKELSKLVYKDLELNFKHKKKDDRNVKDDIQHVGRTILVKEMPGNDGVLVVGKFRLFTNGHKKMFDQALKKHDYLVVTLVSNKETKATLELRKKMIEAVYPGVYIITTTSGNLFTMINKSTRNINTVLAGSDRVDGYKKQLEKTLDIGVEEIIRTDEDESATKVIRSLNDQKYFKKNTPKSIHKFYDELLKVYNQGESFRKQHNKTIIKEAIDKAELNK